MFSELLLIINSARCVPDILLAQLKNCTSSIHINAADMHQPASNCIPVELGVIFRCYFKYPLKAGTGNQVYLIFSISCTSSSGTTASVLPVVWQCGILFFSRARSGLTCKLIMLFPPSEIIDRFRLWCFSGLRGHDTYHSCVKWRTYTLLQVFQLSCLLNVEWKYSLMHITQKRPLFFNDENKLHLYSAFHNSKVALREEKNISNQ